MWLQFPKGCERISVEQQLFEVEKVDDAGIGYGRVPDHFAPKVLAVGGFKALTSTPDNFPDDLPKADPLRDGAISTLTQTNESYKAELANLRSDVTAAHAQIRALMAENEKLRQQNARQSDAIVMLQDYIEDKGLKLPEGLGGEPQVEGKQEVPQAAPAAKAGGVKK